MRASINAVIARIIKIMAGSHITCSRQLVKMDVLFLVGGKRKETFIKLVDGALQLTTVTATAVVVTVIV